MLDDKPSHGLTRPDYSVPPVVRAIKVLRYIAAGNSVANQSQAARAIGINRTTLLRLLCTLELEGFIEKIANGDDYTLGTGVIELAAHKIFSLDVAQAARPVLERLTAALGLSSHLGILDDREVLYLLRCTPNRHLVSNVHVGTRLPAHASTMGRAILAHLPFADVEALFETATLFAVTVKTPTSIAALGKQLEQARAAGYADARSSFEVGIDAIAAPIFDHSGRVIAAINVSGPERAFAAVPGHRAEIAEAVMEAAREIGRRLGHVERTPPPTSNAGK